MGMTRAGSYFYQQNRDEIEYITVAKVPTAGGKAPSAASNASENIVGLRPVWSPDGKSIAFKRHHLGNSDAYDLVVLSLATPGEERTYTTTLGFTSANEALWLNDGMGIVEGISHGPGTPISAYRVDLKTGEFKPLAESQDRLSRADRMVYAVRHDPNAAAGALDHVVEIDLRTGQERQILNLPAAPGPGSLSVVSLSPNRRTLAIRWHDSKLGVAGKTYFARVGVDGSGYREIHVMSRLDAGDSLAWTSDGQGILFNQRHDYGYQLMRIPADGGGIEPIGIEGKGTFLSLNVSPDGSRVAFSSVQRGSQVWVLDNLLSAVK